MNEHYPFVNPPLPYAYNALEPYIDTTTMYVHHDRLQQRYVTNLNDALSNYPELQTKSLEEMLTSPEFLPEEIRQTVINNGGGVYNHTIYFSGMTNSLTRSQAETLYPVITRDFGTIENFFDEFKATALKIFGSGYAWLVSDLDGYLSIMTTPNQNTPLSYGLCVIANIDVWEHAYFLKRYNDRAAYLEDFFHVVSWEAADERYKKCMGEA